MCNERERLIGYVYDEMDARDRRAVEAHLVECHVCRAEVAALKGVRADLLAWDVPAAEPIWRPLAPAPAPVPIWRQVPAWAMAAAATLVFGTGLAGGMATRVWWPMATTAQASTSPALPVSTAAAAAPADITPAGVTPQDLAALEAKVLARVRAEMSQQVREAAVATASAVPSGRPAVEVLSRQVRALEQWQYEQVVLNEQFDRKLRRLGVATSTLDARMSTDADIRMGVPVSFGGVR